MLRTCRGRILRVLKESTAAEPIKSFYRTVKSIIVTVVEIP